MNYNQNQKLNHQNGYVNWEAESFLYLMSQYELPEVLAKQDPEVMYKEVKEKFPRDVSCRKISNLIKASRESISIKSGIRMAPGV